MELFINGERFGNADLLETIKLKRKKSKMYTARIKLQGDEGVMMKLAQIRMKKPLKSVSQGQFMAP